MKAKGMCSSPVMLDCSQAFNSFNHELVCAKMRFMASVIIQSREEVNGLPQLYSKLCTSPYADDCQLPLLYEPGFIDKDFDKINPDPALCQRGVGVCLSGESLCVSNSAKALGVMLDSELTLSDHVTHAIQRALGRLRDLYRCRIRFIFNVKRFDHVYPFLDAVSLPTMENLCRILTRGMIHRVLAQGEPQYLSESLRFREVSLRSILNGDTAVDLLHSNFVLYLYLCISCKNDCTVIVCRTGCTFF
ncbi:hypothetical protein J6590_024591 [Homalodisca vitripennis]|nr:hypothetical protein J6590_024591 [Homalodisca vitripennis]